MKDSINSAIIGVCLLGGLLGGAYILKPTGGPAPGPAPVVSTLKTLVDAKSAAELSAFYSAFSKAVASGSCSTVGDYREAHIIASKSLQDALPAEGWAAINAPIEARVTAAVGLDDAPLDAGKRTALATSLASIAQEFGG